MQKVLVIEDDLSILKLMEHHFKQEINISFVFKSSFSEGVSTIASEKFDQYIIDINLNDFSGLDILRILQKEKNIDNRVIVMSAKSDTKVRIEAYDLGASNFIKKPIEFDLLRSMLRKNIRATFVSNEVIINNKFFILNPLMNSLVLKENDEEVHLSVTEYNIFYRLARSPNIVISKEDLSFLGKDKNESMSFKALEMHIKNIRKKTISELILTKRGFGYYMKI